MSHIKQAVSGLDYIRCTDILSNRSHVRSNVGENNFPIFVYICQQKVIWKSACEHVNIDMDSKWSKESLRDHLCHQQNGKHCLQKILVDGIFEQFILLFVEFGYNVNATDISGLAAIHYAIKHGLRLTTEILIDSGASLSKEAKISSWIHTKLPALYHCLYTLDVEMTKLVLEKSDIKILKYHQLDKRIDDCLYLPKNIPVLVQACLMEIDKFNPLSFVLIIIVMKSYSNSSLNTEVIETMISTCRLMGSVLLPSIDEVGECLCPDSLLEFYRTSLEEVKRSGIGACQEIFFFRLIKVLFHLDDVRMK